MLNIAKLAVKKSHIPFALMDYEEQLSSALFGIALGLKKYEVERWQSLREWLSMQALYQIRTDAHKKSTITAREVSTEELAWAESLTATPLALLLSDETSDKLEKLMAKLTRRQRALVRRIAIGGETFAAVAKRLRLPRGQIMREYRAALKLLAQTAKIDK